MCIWSHKHFIPTLIHPIPNCANRSCVAFKCDQAIILYVDNKPNDISGLVTFDLQTWEGHVEPSVTFNDKIFCLFLTLKLVISYGHKVNHKIDENIASISMSEIIA